MSGRRHGRLRRWVLPVVAAALLLGGWWITRAMRSQGDVEWVEARRGDLVLGVEVTGTLRATDTSKLGPPPLADYWEFKISFMAPEGEDVPQGTPVLGFDTTELEQRLVQQVAERDQAQKQIEKTEKDLEVSRRGDRLRLAEAEARLRKAQLKVDVPEELSQAQELGLARLELDLARQEVDYLRRRLEVSARSAEAQLATLRNQRDRADGQVRDIETAIEQMNVSAPRDGTVIYVTNWRDEKKKVGDSCWKQEKVIELPDLGEMKGDGQVDEAEVGRVVTGQRVRLRLDAHPDVTFTGAVDSIWKTVRRQSWRTPQKVARLEVALDETDRRRMRPGMRFRGTIETERVADALKVPLETIFVGPDGPRVYRRGMFGYDEVRVKLGRRNEGSVEVLDGLDEGDALATVDLGRREGGAA